jgi:xanthine/CO dehydrogenase XdhC/CoxF family maturation factor
MVRSQPYQSNPPAEHLWIAGDTPISRAVGRLAEFVAFRVSVFASPDDVLSDAAFSPLPTNGIVLLDSFEEQVAVLVRWMNLPLVFLGVVGSRERRREILSHLAPMAATRERIERIHCPVGLPIGAASVEESAIAIVAHLIQNRSDRRISHDAASRIKSPSLIKARA